MQQRQINRGNKSVNFTLPAPITGLNVRDSLDTMRPTDAIVLDNYIPLDTKIALRKGYRKYVSTDNSVQTLVEYKKPGDNRFLAISNGKFYDISNKNEVTFLVSEEITFNVSYFFDKSNNLLNALSGFFNSLEPRVILHSDILNFLAISRCVVPLSISFTNNHRIAKSFNSAGVKRHSKKSHADCVFFTILMGLNF